MSLTKVSFYRRIADWLSFNFAPHHSFSRGLIMDMTYEQLGSISQAELMTMKIKMQISNMKKIIPTNISNNADEMYVNLLKENEKLKEEIELYKNKIISLRSGDTKINKPRLNDSGALAGNKHSHYISKAGNEKLELKAEKKSNSKTDKVNAKKEVVVSKPKSKEPSKNIDHPTFGVLDFRVGRIIEIEKHPDAESLYVEKIDLGEDNPRTVVSGLVKYVSIDSLKDKLVIVLCNLKPAKMRGVLSEGMVMCASTPEAVEVLIPPSDSVPGDVIKIEGIAYAPEKQLNPKKKVYETLSPMLKVNASKQATYDGQVWYIEGKGPVQSSTLCNVAIK